MMDITFLTGLLGGIVVVLGAAWKSNKPGTPAVKSVKDWLFAIGGFILLLYSILNYIAGGPFFFVILEMLVAVASILMMLDIDDRIDTVVLSVSGLVLVIWSFFLFEGYNTIIFILGLVGLGLGYDFKMGSIRRDVALVVGSLLISTYSYLEASWIFFWLNAFFAVFSVYYLLVHLKLKKST